MLKNKPVLFSLNVNKIALLRNARGEDRPHLCSVIQDCIQFGAQGITVHPRPDERHIRYSDLQDIKQLLTQQDQLIEFNIEGYPSTRFLEYIVDIKPDQVTLVPDAPDALTSNEGWLIQENKTLLASALNKLKTAGIRTSLFMHPKSTEWAHLPQLGVDRVELFTKDYASHYFECPNNAISSYQKAAKEVATYGLEVNAGHDLNQENLAYFVNNIELLKEVSIGHALICEALYEGLEKTVKSYRALCKRLI